jgi:molecular chaperone DnaJ
MEFRIRNKGIPHLNGNRRGDLRVVVDLQVPKELSSYQRRLLEELAHSWNHDSGAEDGEDGDQDKDKGLFDRLRDAFG